MALAAVLLSVALSRVYFTFSSYEQDTVSFLFQAKLFAQGRLAEQAPADIGFSTSPHINVLNDRWYSKYPFGNALILTLGVLVGVPWLVPAILTGASLFILYLILGEVYAPPLPLLGSLLALISPLTLVMGAVWFSEATSRFFVGLFLLWLLRAAKIGSAFYAALSGFALGFAFNTRPLTAVVFGIGAAGLWIYLFARQPRKELVRNVAIFSLALALMVLLYMGWNWRLTGNPLMSTHNAMQPYDTLGFGLRGTGYFFDRNGEDLFDYTPTSVLRRVLTKTIPALSFNSLGWGYYHPDMARNLASWSDPRASLILLLRAFPLLLPLLLMTVPLLSGSRNRYDFLFLSLPLLTLIAYSFYWWDGASAGFDPTFSRYYCECTLFGVIPLIARGLETSYAWLRRRTRAPARAALGLLIALLLLNTTHSYTRFAKPLRSRGEAIRRIERFVQDQDIHKAVIFTSNILTTPLGDYPFKSLQDADIVYFRLGHSKRWGLHDTEWLSVYQQYFSGRKAYLYKNGQITLLHRPD